MAVGTLYTTAGTCRDCGRALGPSAPANRLYCDDDRARRRAVTFLVSAGVQVDHLLTADPARAGARAAKDHVVAALEELGG